MNDMSDGNEGRSGPDIAGLVISAGLLGLAGLCLWDAWELGGGPSYSRVGPAVAAEIVAFGLGVLAIFNAVYSWRGGYIDSEPYDLAPVLIIGGGFAVLIAIIWLDGGFIPGMTIIFAATCYAFGRRAVITDVIVGFVLALLVYLVFTKLLTLSLPTGPLESLL
jgi:putative tricarboxylic transport membrane protein